MSRILAFTNGPGDWQALLADPVKHWKAGFSARTLAHCWEAADGFPIEIDRALRGGRIPELAELVPILAIPEFKVPLPGGDRASQNDIFVLARNQRSPVVIMVEGKVEESFGPTIDEWMKGASPGKHERRKFLLRAIGLTREIPGSTRYQFLHRAASAVVTAEQYRAAAAVMVVHTFSKRDGSWNDYASFLDLYSIEAVRDRVQRLSSATRVPLYAAWVAGNQSFLSK